MRSAALKWSGFTLAIACCFVLAGCGSGSGKSEGPKIVPSGKSTISGVVTGSGPVAGAKVSTDVGEYITTTDADGKYSLTVDPGQYTLIVHVNGRQTASVQDLVVSANETIARDVAVGPALEPGEKTYVGSLRCKLCHNELYQRWKTTGHATNLKTGDTAIVPGARAQFESGLDLAAEGSFDAYTPAPVLGYNAATDKYTITIGNIIYPVDRAQGGGRGFIQRYQTKIGNSYYILPVQYSDANGDWVTFDPDKWYAEDGTPLYTDPATLLADVNKPDSYDRQCAGCHHTGMDIQLDDAGEYVATYTELNNGCEACHGPGSEHIVSERPEDIVNPSGLGHSLENQVCAKCHMRGQSTASLGGQTFGYPWGQKDFTAFEPGDFLNEYAMDAGAYWNDSMQTSIKQRQQSNDFASSAHFTKYGVSCSDCHDPHGSPVGTERDLVADPDDNELCLLCHGGQFATDAALEAHTHHSSPDSPNCVNCHMPLVAKSAIAYDIHSHTFAPISPAESLKMRSAGQTPIPNSCMNGSCHTDWDINSTDDLEEALGDYNDWYGTGGAPEANAGPDQLAVGFDTTVKLNGQLSVDPDDGAIATSSWSQSGGDHISADLDLTDPAHPALTTAGIEETFASVGFTIPNRFGVLPGLYDTEGAYNITLAATDSDDNTSTDSVVVTSANRMPGGNNVPIGTRVYLNAGADLESYNWSVVSAPTETALANPTTRFPSFTPKVGGKYVISEATQGTLTLYAASFVGTDRCAVCHPGKVNDWEGTGHAHFFQEGIEGEVSSHYGESCIGCHTVGYDLSPQAANGGFDDVAKALGWVFPSELAEGNWDNVPDQLKSVANIGCESCHGPGSEHNGNVDGISKSLNSEVCGTCHGGAHHPQYPGWSQSGHFKLFDPTEHYTSSPSCLRCHDGTRFVAEQIDGEAPLDNLEGHEVLPQTCSTCHDPHHESGNGNQLRDYGEVSLPEGFTVDVGPAKVCVMCHNSRQSDPAGKAISSTTGPHVGNQSETFFGTGAVGDFEYPDAAFDESSLTKSFHARPDEFLDPDTGTFQPCVTCHMVNGTHVLEATSDACAECHAHSGDWDEWGASGTFNRPAANDYDGDGVVEGVRDEYDGLLARVLAVLTDGVGSGVGADLGFGNTWLGNYPYWQLADGLTEAQQRDIQRAMYNYVLFNHDPASPIHNTAYMVQVLRRTWAAMGKLMLDDPSWEPPGSDYQVGPLVANAGADQLAAGFGSQVTLNAGGSFDPDGDILSYTWTQNASDPVQVDLDMTDPAAPTFTMPNIEDIFAARGFPLPKDEFGVVPIPYDVASTGTFNFTVEASDGENSATDSVQVTATSRSVGGPNVPLGAPVQLNGGVLDTYDWQIVSKPSGSASTLINADSRYPTFVPDKLGEYVISEATQGTLTLYGSKYAGTDFCAQCHQDKVDSWQTTGHAHFFEEGIQGFVSSHYGESCIGCHTVGNEPGDSANGFDEVADQLGWQFPEIPDPAEEGNWDLVPDVLKSFSNIGCESCHGPGDQGGNAPHVVNDAYSAETCAVCHGGSHHPQYAGYLESGHFNLFDPSAHYTTSTSCLKCHDGKRFVAEQIDGQPPLENLPDSIIPQTCATCHDPHHAQDGEPGQLRAFGEVSLPEGLTADVGPAKICIMCHNSRQPEPEDRALSSFGGPHVGNQSETYFGTGAIGTFEYPGAAFDESAVPNSFHANQDAFLDPETGTYKACVTCHISATNHSVKPEIETCAECHEDGDDWDEWGGADEPSFNRPADGDFDGDGVVEGILDEYQGLKDRVLAVLTDGVGSGVGDNLGFGNTFLGSYPYWQLAEGLTEDQERDIRRAMYNFVLFEHDDAAALHNTSYAINVLRRTWAAMGKLKLEQPSWQPPGDEIQPLSNEPFYVGSKTCSACHDEEYNDFIQSGHPYKIMAVKDAQPPVYPFSEVPNTPDGFTWGDMSYVIGGYGWKARFIDLTGNILTDFLAGDPRGPQLTQYNLATQGWVSYSPHEEGFKPYTCGACHTTGWQATGPEGPHQDGLPGIYGTWAEPGVQCEACHGPGSVHAASMDKNDIVVDESAELCGSCHFRDAQHRIAASGSAGSEFINHHEQYDEMINGAHDELTCSSCHDPHKGSHYDGLGGVISKCTDCHSDITIDRPSMASLECTDCHMPKASKSAVSTGSGVHRKGDLHTHIFGINTDPAAEMFYEEDGKTFANGFLTLDFACLGCHNGTDAHEIAQVDETLADIAKSIHGTD